MLRAVSPNEPSREVAYRVPWFVDRLRAPKYVVTNVSTELAGSVCFQFTCSEGQRGVKRCADVAPGRSFLVDASSVYPHDVSVSVMWYRADGVEYVWTFVD